MQSLGEDYPVSARCAVLGLARSSYYHQAKPSENGYVERLIRTIKEEEVNLSDYQSIEEAREQLGNFIDVDYNQLRPHSGLDYQRPAEREAQWLQNNPSKVLTFGVQQIRTTTGVGFRPPANPKYTRSVTPSLLLRRGGRGER